MKRAVLYLRVSTLDQTTANQERELREVAGRMGCEIAHVYKDHGISGTKGREKRPAFDRLCKDATQRKFDVVMAWSVDRLGRSLQDLIGFLSELHALRIDLFLHQQGLDTATPAGKAMFQMMAAFLQFVSKTMLHFQFQIKSPAIFVRLNVMISSYLEDREYARTPKELSCRMEIAGQNL